MARDMRPDRVVIDDAEDDEPLHLLTFAYGGYESMLFSMHADNLESGIKRLETTALLYGGTLPLPLIRRQIVGAIDIVIQVQRMDDARRRLISISRLDGCDMFGRCRLRKIWDSRKNER